jgi:ferredoxin-like protein FixX
MQRNKANIDKLAHYEKTKTIEKQIEEHKALIKEKNQFIKDINKELEQNLYTLVGPAELAEAQAATHLQVSMESCMQIEAARKSRFRSQPQEQARMEAHQCTLVGPTEVAELAESERSRNRTEGSRSSRINK